MTAQLIDGTAIAADIRAEVAERARRSTERGVQPGLAAILVGENPASISYVTSKAKACAEAGIFSETFHLPAETTQEELLRLVSDLNHDRRFHGILPQLPFPPQINEATVIDSVDPAKDVDGLHPQNLGRLLRGETTGALPCTPHGVVELLLRTGNDPAGKHVVVAGRSTLVGRPLAVLLSNKAKGGNATVTICHTATTDLGAYTRTADIVVMAAGRPNTLRADMVKPGAVVIDVGTNRIDDASRKRGWRLVGDADFPALKEICSWITPVPGGVGPMTIAMLLVNTVRAAEWTLEETHPIG
ncbi:MAG: bifunctional 5,10-methylenetetrahydrofolate dehydrogenase/5,10-methenyltetrahydrofolate cyclohydrolase [Dehalococcoidia bacterium]